MLDDFTERLDTDVSNNAGLLHVPGPPRSLGLYRDGNRIAALPMPPGPAAAYAPSALDALPYTLVPHARVLLAGASGGFRIAELLALGVAQVRVLEPEPALLRALRHGMGPSPPWHADPRVTLSGASPLAAVRAGRRYDVIDVSADFLDAAEANATAFTVQAIAADLDALTPGGIVSLPVSIRDFPVYALRVLATARAALLRAGVADPAAHVVVYRSAWGARVLLSRDALVRGAHRGGAQILRRPVVRRVLVSRHRRARRARRTSTTTCRRCRSRPARWQRPAPTTPSPTRPARCWPARPARRARRSTWRR